MSINKKDVVRLLETIAVYMELKGENPFKTAAFRKAALAYLPPMRRILNFKTVSNSLLELLGYLVLSLR